MRASAVIQFSVNTCSQVLSAVSTAALQAAIAQAAGVDVSSVSVVVRCTPLDASREGGRLLQTDSGGALLQVCVGRQGGRALFTWWKSLLIDLCFPHDLCFVQLDATVVDASGTLDGTNLLDGTLDSNVLGGLSFTISSTTTQQVAAAGCNARCSDCSDASFAGCLLCVPGYSPFANIPTPCLSK